MSPASATLSDRSRVAVPLERFATIDDPRDVRRVTHPLDEMLLLVAWGTSADCEDYGHIAAWGETHPDFLRRHLPCANGLPSGRWPTILMNRINPALFSAAFTAWVRATWPGGVLPRPTARHRGAATTTLRGQSQSTWSPPSPQPLAWCRGRRRCLAKPTS